MSTTIRISTETEEYIAAHGKFGESHDDVIRRRLMSFGVFLRNRNSQKEKREQRLQKVRLQRVKTQTQPQQETQQDSPKDDGKFHSQDEFKPYLLRVLALSKNQQLHCKDAIDAVGKLVVLTESDKVPHRKSKAIRWRNNVQWARDKLVKSGFIMSPKEVKYGVWKLTPLGLVAARKLLQ